MVQMEGIISRVVVIQTKLDLAIQKFTRDRPNKPIVVNGKNYRKFTFCLNSFQASLKIQHYTCTNILYSRISKNINLAIKSMCIYTSRALYTCKTHVSELVPHSHQNKRTLMAHSAMKWTTTVDSLLSSIMVRRSHNSLLVGTGHPAIESALGQLWQWVASTHTRNEHVG